MTSRDESAPDKGTQPKGKAEACTVQSAGTHEYTEIMAVVAEV